MCSDNAKVIRRAKVIIEISGLDKSILEIICRSVSPENKLAPPGIKIFQKLDLSLIFYCDTDFSKNPRLKISSLRRTLDDLLASILIALKSIKTIHQNGDDL